MCTYTRVVRETSQCPAVPKETSRCLHTDCPYMSTPLSSSSTTGLACRAKRRREGRRGESRSPLTNSVFRIGFPILFFFAKSKSLDRPESKSSGQKKRIAWRSTFTPPRPRKYVGVAFRTFLRGKNTIPPALKSCRPPAGSDYEKEKKRKRGK